MSKNRRKLRLVNPTASEKRAMKDRILGHKAPGRANGLSLAQTQALADGKLDLKYPPVRTSRNCIRSRFKSGSKDPMRKGGTVYTPGSRVSMRDGKVYYVAGGGNLVYDDAETYKNTMRRIERKNKARQAKIAEAQAAAPLPGPSVAERVEAAAASPFGMNP